MTTVIKNMLLALACAANAAAQMQRASPASIRVHDLSVGSLDALQSLAEKYRVVIGQYGSLAETEVRHTVDISIKNGTLADAFDAIVKADPWLQWSAASNGAIHFIIRGLPPPTLFELTIRSLDLKNPLRGTASSPLSKVPEVAGWLNDHGCAMGEVFTGSLRTWGKFTVRARNVSFLALLDEIAARSHTYYWSAVQAGSNPCVIYLDP